MSEYREPDSPGGERPASADILAKALCIAILVGLSLVWPIVPAHADMHSAHRFTQATANSMCRRVDACAPGRATVHRFLPPHVVGMR